MLGNIADNKVWTIPSLESDSFCLEENDNNEGPFKTATINECSRKCVGMTSYFAYGTNEFGGQGCQEGLCKCYCIRAMETQDESCHQKNYWLLKFKSGVSFDVDGKSIKGLNE